MAILLKEEGHLSFSETLARAVRSDVSAGTWIELAAVITRRRLPQMEADLHDLVANFAIRVMPVSTEQAQIGYDAYRAYGRGSGHRADLNFGDCFSYALAKATGRPLLYKGTDFAATDIAAAA